MEMGNGNSGDEGSSGSGGEDLRDAIGNGYDSWTNQRHCDYLSSMESTFVNNMMESHRSIAAAAAAAHHHQRLLCHGNFVNRLENFRLDRFVPDISESTLDSQTTKNHSRTSEKISNAVSRSGRSKRHKERPTHPYKISHDQVVPHIEEKACDNASERPI